MSDGEGQVPDEFSPHPEYWARRFPDKPAVILFDLGELLTYGQLACRANQAARVFADQRVAAGDTIAILSENNLAYAEWLWAAKNSGIRYVAVSSHLNAADASYVIRDSGARLLVASHSLADLSLEVSSNIDPATRLLMSGGTVGSFQDYVAARDAQSTKPLPGRRRGSSMLYSSGTIGRPKGVRTELADVPPEVPPGRFAMIVKQYQLDQDTVFMDPGPLYHAGPQRFMMMTHRAGGTVLSSARFEPLLTLEAMQLHGATHGFFVPTMFRRMLRLPDNVRSRLRPSTMRHAIHGAAPCPHDVKRRMIEWWGMIIEELYGGTEAFGHAFISSKEWLEHPGSVGRPPAGCQIKIVGPLGEPLPPNAIGRIMMRNGLQFDYHGEAAKGSLTHDASGFASLGDIGYLDEEGYLYLTDRESHMIIAGGVNIYPQEAEQVLGSHPGVEDVAVIGIPDEDFGEQVKALVVRQTGDAGNPVQDQELIEWCREHLSSYKCPRSIQFVDSLPRNELGKLVKRLLPREYFRSTGSQVVR